MSTRSASSPDLLAESDVMACCALALLPFATQDETQALIRDFLRERSFYNEHGRKTLTQSLETSRFALLNVAWGPSDFHYLPIRVSKTIGWLVSDVIIDHILGRVDQSKNESIRSLLETILDIYHGSLIAMSDQQAPHIYLLAKACKLYGWDDLATVVLNATFASFLSVRGAVARVDLEPSKVFDYTIARAFGKPDYDLNMIARPSQLLAALMLSASPLGLAKDWDKYLVTLDHKSTNMFLPDDYLNFGAEIIYEGANYTFMVGHDVWTLEDLTNLFDKNCRASIQDNETIRPDEVKALGILASYLFPNRIPFFLECW